MKYLLTAIMVISCSSSIYSQVYKFKTFQSYYKKTGDTHHIQEDEWNNIDFLVVINMDKSKINTYGQAEGDYDITKLKWKDRDESGNNYLDWEAIDEKGDKVETLLVVYADKSGKHMATLTFIYPYGTLYFRLKKDD